MISGEGRVLCLTPFLPSLFFHIRFLSHFNRKEKKHNRTHKELKDKIKIKKKTCSPQPPASFSSDAAWPLQQRQRKQETTLRCRATATPSKPASAWTSRDNRARPLRPSTQGASLSRKGAARALAGTTRREGSPTARRTLRRRRVAMGRATSTTTRSRRFSTIPRLRRKSLRGQRSTIERWIRGTTTRRTGRTIRSIRGSGKVRAEAVRGVREGGFDCEGTKGSVS